MLELELSKIGENNMSRFITQKEQDDLDNMLCEQYRKRKKKGRK